jgi:omega-amidase
MSGLRVSLVQQPLLWQDPSGNRAHFERVLAPLAGKTDLVVLPETFTTGFSMDVGKIGEPAGGESVQWLRRQAAALDAAVTGSVVTREDGRYYNRLSWVTPDQSVRHYDKRHLFRMGGEHEHFTAGGQAWSVPWRGLRVCPLVCYDLRFPVYSRRRADLDYDLLLYVANWPAPRADVWRALLPARAIENQAYVIGVNRVGTDGVQARYAGDSMAIDFRGRSLAQAHELPGVLTVELPVAPLQAFRERFPAHLDADQFSLHL